jgi:hypothetical protein
MFSSEDRVRGQKTVFFCVRVRFPGLRLALTLVACISVIRYILCTVLSYHQHRILFLSRFFTVSLTRLMLEKAYG